MMESETNRGYGAAANCRSTFDARKAVLGIPPGHRWRYEIFDFQGQPKLSSGSRSSVEASIGVASCSKIGKTRKLPLIFR
jgi:hypothetical protein